MTHNSSRIEKLRSEIAKEVRINYLVPTDIPVSFSSIFEDLEKKVKEVKEEFEEADKLLNQVLTTTKFSVYSIQFWILRH